MHNDTEWDEEFADHEYPDEDSRSDDERDTVPCPACGVEIDEDAVRCPACGDYVETDRRPLSGKPWWFVALGIIGVIAALCLMLIP